MPLYELSLIVRSIPKHELASCVKRAALAIIEKRGMLTGIEYLGTNALPHKVQAHDHVHREGAFFVLKFAADTQTIGALNEEYGRDVDIVRRRIYTVPKPEPPEECTLDAELRPPAYRPHVQEMIKIGKTQGDKYTKHFKYNSGMTYYPFQK